ncbi:hypothetical protein [Cobetia sp. UCD-24C]|uniref:hypothetical protein n=1 Tax=Cobetia sp. UCD-24C TaxID=1716176 RepID=UPI001910F466|nr:hypothetical protein [Cobetia sp. UCD-24C]
MAKHGLDGDKDKDKEEDKPQSLEEHAWARARESGSHRPRTGTPHDWEDWERYHEQLAADSEKLSQKIDRQARAGGSAPAHDDDVDKADADREGL